MKIFFLLCLLIIYKKGQTQANNCEKLIIITIDGTRWQEVFKGADSTILFRLQNNIDATTVRKFWAATAQDRRKKLFPFLWNCVEKNGQLFGNRSYHNNMQVKNIARISYAGYNEIFTGSPDNSLWTNKPNKNKNINVLEYLDNKNADYDSIAVFTSWNIFPYIFNNERNKLLMNCGYNFCNIKQSKINLDTNSRSLATRKDSLTFLAAKTYMENYNPKILYVGFGEADEFGHHKDYGNYLNNLHNIDQMIGAIWDFVQNNNMYKNKTSIIITTDHGRGSKPRNWNKHGFFVKGSNHTWMAVMGNCIKSSGEITTEKEMYSFQIAPTIAHLLGVDFPKKEESLLQIFNQ
jgi:Metalloenzyme superfamily